MIDVRQLPDARDTIHKLGGDESSSYIGLYEIYYQISTAIFDYRMKENLFQKELAERLV